MSHPKLMLKLIAFGISGHLLSSINYFLYTMTQRMKFNSRYSYLNRIELGVKQGSVI